MASTNLILKGTRNPTNIYLRFSNGRAIDFSTPIGVFVNPIYWNKKTQQIRNVIDVENRDEINSKLSKLKIFVIDEYNLLFMQGDIADKIWLEEVVKKHFNRPKDEVKNVNLNHQIYWSDYAQKWLDETAPKYKVKANKYMDETTQKHYRILKKLFVEFEGKRKIRLRDVNAEVLDSFAMFLSDKNYAEATAKRMIGRFRFFCLRAQSDNLTVNIGFKERAFIKEEEIQYKKPYFNEDEISTIFNHDFSDNITLDNVRDNLIIALWTGLRISDFLVRLKTSNFRDGFIEIKTEKTKAWVSLPIHEQIKFILSKRDGSLPNKISEPKFNIHVKTIGCELGFNTVMTGGVMKVDPKTKIKRKVVKEYMKWELITSHIGRRSFATNLYGRLPNNTIMALGGWKTEEMLLHYVQETSRDSAILLQKHWEANY
jgi:integrase